MKNQRKNKVFWKNGLSKLASIFDPILVPTCLRFRSQNQSKLHKNWNLEGIEFLIDFCIDFLSILEGFGVHLGTQLGAMLATFSPQDGSQNASERSRHPTCARTSILEPPGLDFGAPGPRFLNDVSLILGGFFGGAVRLSACLLNVLLTFILSVKVFV